MEKLNVRVPCKLSVLFNKIFFTKLQKMQFHCKSIQTELIMEMVQCITLPYRKELEFTVEKIFPIKAS